MYGEANGGSRSETATKCAWDVLVFESGAYIVFISYSISAILELTVDGYQL